VNGRLTGTAVIFLLKMTYTWLADKNSPYPFTDDEINRWNVEQKPARATAGDTPSR
jgi:hypothetical protein